jgi:hydroxymethylpyrimidine pyrophosphatase-like HAD family hydrolase
MIKAIILDIDGVIVGSKKGVNFPLPAKEVLAKLKAFNRASHITWDVARERHPGIRVCLCSAKAYFGFNRIVELADLAGPHIADAGAIVFDYEKKMVIENHYFKEANAFKLIKEILKNDNYLEIYDLENYSVLRRHREKYKNYYKTHSKILQTKANFLDNVEDYKDFSRITKIVAIIYGKQEKDRIKEIYQDFKDDLELKFTVHPSLKKGEFCVFTKKGISKSQGIKTIQKNLAIPFDNFLGVGDTIGDWDFIKHCKYKATLENGTSEIKNKILTQKENRFIAKGVNENGILEIFKYFGL